MSHPNPSLITRRFHVYLFNDDPSKPDVHAKIVAIRCAAPTFVPTVRQLTQATGFKPMGGWEGYMHIPCGYVRTLHEHRKRQRRRSEQRSSTVDRRACEAGSRRLGGVEMHRERRVADRRQQ